MHIVSEQHLLFQDKGGNQHVSAASDVDWYLAPQSDLISFWKGLSKCQGVVVKTSRLLRSPGKTGGAELLGSGPSSMIFCVVKKHLSQDILVLSCLGLGAPSGISVPPCPDTFSCSYCHLGTLCESESEQGYQGLAPNFVFFALTSLVSAWIIALGYWRCWPLMWHSTSDWLGSNYTSLRIIIL